MAYTGEAIGIDYLFRQTGSSFPVDVNAAIDEGFEDLAEDEVTVVVQEVDSTPVELPTEDDLDIKVRYRLGVCMHLHFVQRFPAAFGEYAFQHYSYTTACLCDAGVGETK